MFLCVALSPCVGYDVCCACCMCDDWSWCASPVGVVLICVCLFECVCCCVSVCDCLCVLLCAGPPVLVLFSLVCVLVVVIV